VLKIKIGIGVMLVLATLTGGVLLGRAWFTPTPETITKTLPPEVVKVEVVKEIPSEPEVRVVEQVTTTTEKVPVPGPVVEKLREILVQEQVDPEELSIYSMIRGQRLVGEKNKWGWRGEAECWLDYEDESLMLASAKFDHTVSTAQMIVDRKPLTKYAITGGIKLTDQGIGYSAAFSKRWWNSPVWGEIGVGVTPEYGAEVEVGIRYEW